MTGPAPFLRTTVVSAGRTLDVVLPTSQPVVSLLPGLLDLVEDRSDGVVYDLLTTDGRAVDLNRDLAGSGLRDGVLLQLVPRSESPPEPVVYDMVDAVEDITPVGAWTRAARAWVLAVTAAALLLVAAASWVTSPGAPTRAVLLGLGSVLLVGSAGAALARVTGPAWVAAVTSWGLLLVGLLWGERSATTTGAGLTALAAAVVLSAGWCARRLRAALGPLVVLAVLAGTTAVTRALVDEVVLVAAVVLVVAAAVLGLLPRVALVVAGVFGLDNRIVAGETVRRLPVDHAVASAHWALAGAVAVAAAAFAVSGYLVAAGSGLDPWLLGLVGAASVGWLVRSRHFPLAVERGLLWLAGVCVVAGAARAVLAAHPGWTVGVVAVLLAAASLVLVLVALPESALRGAVGRRWANRLEAVCIVLTVPVLVGAFGVYADLLATF